VLTSITESWLDQNISTGESKPGLFSSLIYETSTVLPSWRERWTSFNNEESSERTFGLHDRRTDRSVPTHPVSAYAQLYDKTAKQKR
jgi:hypothetical protein